MTNKPKHTILTVDDEEGILKSLKRLLNDLGAEIIAAKSGDEALEILGKTKASIIISDQRMPGMGGVEFLGKSRKLSPDSIRILLTGYADINATIDAINSGAVKYYFNKPWDDEQLLSRIKESLDLFDLTLENRRLTALALKQNIQLKEFNNNLEQKVEEQTKEISWQHNQLKKSFMETIKSFSTLIGLRHKGIGNHSHRVASLAKALIKDSDLSDEEYQDITVAAFLHDIGKISLTDKILDKSEGDYIRADIESVQQHPILGQSCLFAITGFEDVGLIIRHHHENYQGGGYPDGLSRDEIPFGSRVIQIADTFDNRVFRKGYPTEKELSLASAYLVQYSNTKFDPELVKRFIERDIAKMFIDTGMVGSIVLQPELLELGMVVASDIYTKSGMFLLPKGAKLSDGMIKRITKMNVVDQIRGGVQVYKQTKAEEVKDAAV